MPQRSVATNFTFEQQRQEINLLAADFWTHKGDTDTAAPTYLKHDGSNAFTGQTLAVPNAFTINANSGSGTVTISGNLDVTGTTTTVSSANLEVTDKNILIAKGSTSDAQADGAGITIDSATDITFNFVDAKDALVSSIGLEGTTFLKAPYGQFTGNGTPSTGQGIEINAPDANTGQIISYDRANTAYKELRLKGSSVALYGGTSNALVGAFNSTGLTMESGKTITGVLATAAQPNITSLGTLTGLTIENALSTNGRASAHGYICRDNFGDATGIGNGMYSPAVDTLGFATNSVERLTLTGDTSYSSFTLKRSATTNQNAVFYYDANYLDIETREATGIRLKTNQGNSLVIESAGNIINSISHTGTSAYFKNTNTTDGFGVRVEGGGTTADRYSLAVFNAAGEEKFRVNANGNCGIGASQPAANLHIGASGGDDVNSIRIDGTNNSSGGQVHRFVIENQGDSALVNFKTSAANANETTKVTINSISGHVGIGVNPATILHVRANTGDLLRLDRDNQGAVGNQIAFRHKDAGSAYVETCSINAVASTNAVDGNLRFNTKPSGGTIREVMRLDQAGTLSLKGDTDTYLDHAGTNTWQVVTNGNLCTEFSANQRVRMPQVYSTNGSSMRDVQIESDGTLCAGNTSIRAAKKNIVSQTDVSWLYNLNPVTFNYRKHTVHPTTGVNTYLEEASDETSYGLIAEEVETVKKDFCFYNGSDLAGVDYKSLITPLLKALQDQKKEIETLKTKVESLS